MKTYTVDKQGRKQPVDWHDFMTNDENLTLVRLADELVNDTKFWKMLTDKGYDDERTNSRTYDSI